MLKVTAMREYRMTGLAADRPDHYLACVGLTIAARGALHFDGARVPTLSSEIEDLQELGHQSAAELQAVLGLDGIIPPDIRDRPFVTNPDPARCSEQDQAVSMGWSDAVDWTHLVNFAATTTDKSKYQPHHLLLNYKDGSLKSGALSKMWAPAEAKSYLRPKRPTIHDITEHLAEQVIAILRGERPTVQLRPSSLGSFSPGDVQTNVGDGSGLKAISVVVDTLAIMAMPVFLPQSHSPEDGSRGMVLRWQLNPAPLTMTGLSALQRGRVEGLPTFQTRIVSVGKGYRRLDQESTNEVFS
jgi:hypothetical protein